MLIVTGVLIALVLVVLVGNTVRTLQGVGWLPITPLDVEFPLWMGTWLGVFPTVETLVAQAGAFAFVIGSYFAAEWWRKRRLRRAIAEYREGEAAAPEPAPAPVGAAAANGNGAGEAAARRRRAGPRQRWRTRRFERQRARLRAVARPRRALSRSRDRLRSRSGRSTSPAAIRAA